MFEYHGWATLRLDTYEEDEAGFSRFVEKLKAELDSFGTGSDVLDVRVVNGAYHLWIAGMPNRKRGRIMELFPFIAEHAPGSYGLLYVWDDEDPTHANSFRVWRLVRGRVDELADHLLSPCIPTIEDPELESAGRIK